MAQPFTASLGEIVVPVSSKKRAIQEAAKARQKALDEVRAEASSQGWQEGFEAGQKSGYQAGFDQAHSEASNEQNEMLRAFAADLQRQHDRFEEAVVKWCESAEETVEVLAVDIAEKLVHAQLGLDRSFVIQTTKDALQQLTEANTARIRVNPFDSVILSNAREELLAATASLRGVEIVDDDTILGGCVIETDRGAVDATIETRLKLLEGGLEDVA